LVLVAAVVDGDHSGHGHGHGHDHDHGHVYDHDLCGFAGIGWHSLPELLAGMC
jgi:hypothetical protein